MKHIAPVRQALGVRTVFNILGPLANPAAPPFHVIGAFSDEIAALMAETLAGLPLTRAFVVHGTAGWDEATPVGPFVCYDVRPGRVARSVRDPRDAGIERCALEELRGAETAVNAARLKAALGRRRHGRSSQRARAGRRAGARGHGHLAPMPRARWPGRARRSLSGAAARLVDGLAAFGKERSP